MLIIAVDTGHKSKIDMRENKTHYTHLLHSLHIILTLNLF